jgi:imidazolonepropionase
LNQETLLIRGARQLLTLSGDSSPRRGAAIRNIGVIPDGAVLIRNGLSVDVGPSRRIENLSRARGAREINAAGRIVMPGFVDSHTHLIHGSPWLGYYEARISGGDASAEDFLGASAAAIHNLPAGRLAARAQTVLKGMARHGTTTLEAKSGFGLDQPGEMKILRALSSVNQKPLDVVVSRLAMAAAPREYNRDRAAYVEWLCGEHLRRVARRKLASFADIVYECDGFTLEETRRFLHAARSAGLLIKMHTAQWGETGGVQLAAEFDAISVDHLEWATPADIERLGRSASIATLLPGSAFHLRTGKYAPARDLIDAGAAIALATDYNPHTSPTYNMQFIISLACGQMGLTPAEAITAATINGAHAIRCAGQVGSLQPGKYADVVLLNAGDYREIPYHFGVNLVHMTIKRGTVIYKEGPVGDA